MLSAKGPVPGRAGLPVGHWQVPEGWQPECQWGPLWGYDFANRRALTGTGRMLLDGSVAWVCPSWWPAADFGQCSILERPRAVH